MRFCAFVSLCCHCIRNTLLLEKLHWFRFSSLRLHRLSSALGTVLWSSDKDILLSFSYLCILLSSFHFGILIWFYGLDITLVFCLRYSVLTFVRIDWRYQRGNYLNTHNSSSRTVSLKINLMLLTNNTELISQVSSLWRHLWW